MGKLIIKIADKYMEYSTIVDAIVTRPMTLEQFTDYYLRRSSLKEGFARQELAERLVRVEACGTSCHRDSSV